MTSLTTKQLKFIAAYEGNGTEACRIAGYKGNDNVLAQNAHGLLTNPQVAEAIQRRHEEAIRPLIANREKRQAFWTKTMDDPQEKTADRLRASELLGRSEADFTDNVSTLGAVAVATTVLSEQQFKELRDKFNAEY
jgi:phage terminase small subunit